MTLTGQRASDSGAHVMTAAQDNAIIRVDLDTLMESHTVMFKRLDAIALAVEVLADGLALVADTTPTPSVGVKGKATPKTASKVTPKDVDTDVSVGKLTMVKSKAEAKRLRAERPDVPNSTKFLCTGCNGYAVVSESFVGKHVAKGHDVWQLN